MLKLKKRQEGKRIYEAVGYLSRGDRQWEVLAEVIAGELKVPKKRVESFIRNLERRC